MFGRVSHWWRVRWWAFRMCVALGALAFHAKSWPKFRKLARFWVQVSVAMWVPGARGRGGAR